MASIELLTKLAKAGMQQAKKGKKKKKAAKLGKPDLVTSGDVVMGKNRRKYMQSL